MRPESGTPLAGSFPPTPRDPRQVDLMLELLSTVIESRSVTYVSSPITTGERLAQFLRSSQGSSLGTPGYSERLRQAVIEPNMEETRARVASLRRHHKVVMDPSSLGDVPGWQQADYRYFWGEAIRRFAALVVVLNGWEYSSGCGYEFLCAVQSEIPVVDADENHVTTRRGSAMILAAIDSLRSLGADTHFLDTVHSELVALRSSGAR